MKQHLYFLKKQSHPVFRHLPEDVQTFLEWTLTLTMSSSYAEEYTQTCFLYTNTHSTHRAQLRGVTVISDNRSPRHTALALSSLSASVPSGEFCGLRSQEQTRCGQTMCTLPNFLIRVGVKTWCNSLPSVSIQLRADWCLWNSWPEKI